MVTTHGTTIAIDGKGVLLRGPSGSGKSDLAVRLIDDGASLVADDRSVLKPENGVLFVDAPETIRGKIEVRGLGIVHMHASGQVPLCLVVDLEEPRNRLPTPETVKMHGISVPLVRFSAFEASTTAKIRLAVRGDANDIETG